MAGIILKLENMKRGAIATLSNGQEVRVGGSDYISYLQQKTENNDKGFDTIPYWNNYHMIAVPVERFSED